MGAASPHQQDKHQALNRPLILIACQSVDFYGDAAVCLRLAQGLVSHGAQVRILAEPKALAHLQAMAPEHALESQQGFVHTCALAYWAMDDLGLPGHGLPLPSVDLLLEAFQATLPRAIADQLPDALPRYLVDYLALEQWTTGCQWLAAPDPAFPQRPRYWAAPSLRPDGPGLIQGVRSAKAGLFSRADRQALRRSILQRCGHGLAEDPYFVTQGIENGPDVLRDDDAVFLVFAYCYPDVPLSEFAKSLSHALKEMAERAGRQAQRLLIVEPQCVSNATTGLLSQREFDQCIAACDLALVRGEDSFGTALFWASQWGTPFVWQPYRQANDAHLSKLDAWLQQGGQFIPEWAQLHRYFSPSASGSRSRSDLPETLRTLLFNWRAVEDFCQSLGRAQFARPSFEESLLGHWQGQRHESR